MYEALWLQNFTEGNILAGASLPQSLAQWGMFFFSLRFSPAGRDSRKNVRESVDGWRAGVGRDDAESLV